MKSHSPYVLIVEDDPDQMELLVDYTLSEIRKIVEDESTDYEHREKIKRLQIIRVAHISALQKAVSLYQEPILTILDGNIPDTRDGRAHDQLIKMNHRVTGRHKSVDIIITQFPRTPITMVSSMNRFQRLVSRYYDRQHNLNINFISKSDDAKIRGNIGYNLRKYLRKEAGVHYYRS